MVVVGFPFSDEEPALRPVALELLARLGVTSISLLRDQPRAGLVLEGWAFDPARAGEAVGVRQGVRTLEPLMQMAVSAAPIGKSQRTKGERRDEAADPSAA
jgi:hypothetical protein